MLLSARGPLRSLRRKGSHGTNLVGIAVPRPSDWRYRQALLLTLAARDAKAAFRAVHTLKGVAQNLGFDRLYAASLPLTEALREDKPLEDRSLFDNVETAHQEILNAIEELKA